MGDRHWAASGLLFAIALIVWIALFQAVEPGGGQPRPTDEELVGMLADTRRMGAARVAALVSASLLVAFAAHLFASDDRQRTARTLMAVPTALAFGVLLLTGTGVVTGMADTLRRGEHLDPTMAQALFDAAGGIFAFMPYVAAAFVLAAAGCTPGVMARLGVVIAAVLVLGGASYDLLPDDPLWWVGIAAMIAWLMWIAVTSVVLLRRTPSAG